MKRLFAVAMATVLVAGAWAQGTFTIRRPADGSRVREVVKIRVPKNSIPEGGYLGIMVNGKFLEAVMPVVEGDDYVYSLDTKARNIPDGQTKIEVILYQYSNNNPVVLNRSSVTVNLDNRTSIAAPAEGMLLRYKFVPGTERTYRLTQNSTVSTVTQAQAQLGSRGREVKLDEESVRFLYAVDNAYNTPSGREGLVRIQLLGDKGKGYVWVTPSSSNQRELIMEDQMSSLFHRITNTGREVYSTYPPYFPIDGTTGASRADKFWFFLFPFPILPTAPVSETRKVWNAGVNVDSVDVQQVVSAEKEKFFTPFPGGTGTFEGVEWHEGIPCAKISTMLQVGAKELANIRNVANLPGEAANIQLRQRVWLAIDQGIIVRQELNLVVEALVEGQTAGGGGGFGGGQQNNGAAASGAGEIGLPGGNGKFRNEGFIRSLISPETVFKAHEMLRQQGRPPGGGRPPSAGGPQGGGVAGADGQDGGGFGQGGGFGRGAGGGTAGVKMIQRVTTGLTIELER